MTMNNIHLDLPLSNQEDAIEKYRKNMIQEIKCIRLDGDCKYVNAIRIPFSAIVLQDRFHTYNSFNLRISSILLLIKTGFQREEGGM